MTDAVESIMALARTCCGDPITYTERAAWNDLRAAVEQMADAVTWVPVLRERAERAEQALVQSDSFLNASQEALERAERENYDLRHVTLPAPQHALKLKHDEADALRAAAGDDARDAALLRTFAGYLSAALPEYTSKHPEEIGQHVAPFLAAMKNQP